MDVVVMVAVVVVMAVVVVVASAGVVVLVVMVYVWMGGEGGIASELMASELDAALCVYVCLCAHCARQRIVLVHSGRFGELSEGPVLGA